MPRKFGFEFDFRLSRQYNLQIMAAERLPEPTPEQQSRARLAAAARTLLRDVPVHAQNFGYAAGLLMGEPNGDAVIAGMIEFAVRIAESGHQLVDEGIEEQSGLPVEILDPMHQEGKRPGILVALEGYGMGMDMGKSPLMYGVAMEWDTKGKEEFVRVGITEEGRVFANPRLPYSPRYKKIV